MKDLGPIIRELDSLDSEYIQYLFYDQFRKGKLSFHQIAESHIQALNDNLKEKNSLLCSANYTLVQYLISKKSNLAKRMAKFLRLRTLWIIDRSNFFKLNEQEKKELVDSGYDENDGVPNKYIED